MRKLVTKKDQEKKRRRNQMLLGIILVVVMLASTLGFAFQGGFGEGDSSGNTITYNGFEFVNQGGYWILGNFVFLYNPYQVEDIGEKIDGANKYLELPLYIDTKNAAAEREISNNLGKLAQRVQKACITEMGCGENLPIKTCSDNFIILKESDISVIKQEGNCVYIEGPSEELVKLADQFLFKTFGVRA